MGCTCYLYIYSKQSFPQKMNSEFKEKFTIKRFVLRLLDWVMLVFLFLGFARNGITVTVLILMKKIKLLSNGESYLEHILQRYCRMC